MHNLFLIEYYENPILVHIFALNHQYIPQVLSYLWQHI